MALSPDNLIQTLVDSGVLSAEDATQLAAPRQVVREGEPRAELSPESSAELLSRLKEMGRLSDFQVHTLEREGPGALLLGDYILLDRLGAGGMGEVYRAVHRVMRREVAIKRLKTASVEVPGLAERFMREVRTAARLTHPNIVTAYDAGEDAAGCYLVMEYVVGRDLSVLIREEGALDAGRASAYLKQAAGALAYAHKAGIIHRDIKPANLLIDRYDNVKLLDLGLARVEQTIAEAEHSAHLTLTQADQIVGTLAYMAPEQADDPHAASIAADLYALGCTFCQMLTGQPPFASNSAAQALIAHREAQPPDLSALLPGSLNELYEALLAKDPLDRPASAEQVVETIERCIESGELARWQSEHEAETVAAKPRALQQRARSARPSRVQGKPPHPTPLSSRPAVWIATAALLVLVVGGILIAVLSGQPSASNASGTGADTSAATPTGAQDAVDAGSPGGAAAVSSGDQPGTPADAGLISSAKAAAALQQSQSTDAGMPVALTNSVGMTFRYIPSAGYRRGSTQEQVDWALSQAKAEGYFDRYGEYIESEGPQTFVRFDKPFYIASTEVTVGQFKQFIEATGYKTLPETDGYGGINFKTGASDPGVNWRNPGMDQDETHPVVNLTQPDCIAFCEWLSEKEGVTYRLPTESEWEYACRAGSPGRWCFGDDPSAFYEYGWCTYNSPNGTKPVAQRKPNAFGLYDMHGNVREWVLLNDMTQSDRFGTGVVRGGSFTKPQVLLRSASRVGFKVRRPYPYHGFRVLREVEAGG